MNDSPYAPRPNSAPTEGMVRAAPPAYPAPYAPTPYPAYGVPSYGSVYGTEGGMEAGSGVAGLRRIGAMLWRRRYIIVVTLIAVLGATWFLGRRQITLYQSQASLTVSTSQQVAKSDPGDATGGVDKITQQIGTRSIETQLAVLNSPEIQETAMKLMPEADRDSIRGVSAAPREGTEDIIDINVTALNPKAAQKMADLTRKVYISHTLNTNRKQYDDAIKFANWQRQNISAKLNNATQQLKDFQERTGYVTPERTGDILATQSTLQSQLDGVVRDSREAAAKLTNAQSQAAGIPAYTYRSNAIVPRPEVDALRKKLSDLRIDLNTQSQEFQPSSPQIQALNAEIAETQRQINAQPKTEPSGQVRVDNPIRAGLDEQISQLQNQLRAFSAREGVLRGQLATAKGKASQLPKLQQQLGQLQGEVTNLTTGYATINARYNNYLLNLSALTADAAPLFKDPSAAVSLAGSSKRNILVAGLMGLVLALALAALVDWMDDRVHSEEDAKNALHLPVLAQVPFVRDGAPTLSSAQNAALPSPALENFRMLRTLVAFSPLQTPARSVMLTSSLPGEGKSVCAANLAIAAALSGESVILIDGDLRRPTQHEIFNTSNEIGYSSVANGYCTLQEALQETNTPGLRLLPGGPVEANPFTLLNGARGRQALREAGEMADLVIVDSPPALLFADAQLLASETDAVLLVVSSRDVGKREISRTRALLAQTGTRPVGIVLNKLGAEADSYDKYAAKYYGRYKRPINTTPTEEAMMKPLGGMRSAATAPSGISKSAGRRTETATVNTGRDTAVMERDEEPSAFAVVTPPPAVTTESATSTPTNGQNQATTPFDGARFAALRDSQNAGKPDAASNTPEDRNGRGEIGRGDVTRPTLRDQGVFDSRYDGREDGPRRN